MNNLRPKFLKDILGQDEIKNRLEITVKASVKTGNPMPHMLFDGPPGLGKTTLATALSNTRGVPIEVANGGNIKSIKNMLPYLVKMKYGSILFIDEIHRIPSTVEEFLYPIMEDFRMDIGSEENLSMNLPKFTMIGATTKAGVLSKPFYDRFTYRYTLTLYSIDDLTRVVLSSSAKLGLNLNDCSARVIAKVSRGTPRVSNNLIRWVKDLSDSEGVVSPTEAFVEKAARMIGIDCEGVTRQDRAYMKVLSDSGKPVGLQTISDISGIDKDTICGIIEPFLLSLGKIDRTPKGRILL